MLTSRVKVHTQLQHGTESLEPRLLDYFASAESKFASEAHESIMKSVDPLPRIDTSLPSLPFQDDPGKSFVVGLREHRAVHLMRRYSNPLFPRLFTVDCSHQPPGGVNPRRRPVSRRSKDRVNSTDRAALVREYTAGHLTIAELAERYPISDYSVRIILQEGGVTPRRRTVTTEQARGVLVLWARGDLSLEAIARETSISAANVRLIVTGTDRGTSHSQRSSARRP